MTSLRRFRLFRRLLRDESGGTLVEYAIVALFLACWFFAGYQLIANNANTVYSQSSNEMNSIEESPLPASTP